MELEKFFATYPRLYHMAEKDSWTKIEELGLLSTSALLKKFNIVQRQSEEIELHHRPSSSRITHPMYGDAVVRDQKPMDDAGLERALQGTGLTPRDWYRCLNSKVFFWVSKHRLHRLLNAGSYKEQEHDVLTLDTRSLVSAHLEDTFLCPINSGCTKPMPTPRGPNTFSPISEYPWEYWHKVKRRPKWDAVVEVCVEGGVPDIKKHVVSVFRMKGSDRLFRIAPKFDG